MIFNESVYNQKWYAYRLDELGTFARGKSKHRPRNDLKLFVEGKIPFVQTAEVKSSNLYIKETTQYYNDFGLNQSKLWPRDTLCITIAANIADVALLSFPACFPDSIVGFTANKKTSEMFMYYMFCYISNEIKKRSSGSTQDNINIDYLTTLEFKIPDINYQNKIVGLLKSIDKKIENNNKINSELESMAKTLYDYWFLQFEFPNEEGKPYKSSGGKMVWNDELKREIPKGWEVKKVSEISKLVSGYPFDSDNYKPNGKYNIYTIGNVQDGYIVNDSPNKIDYIPKDIDNDCILKRKDIIMSLTGNVGRVGLVFADNALLNQRVLKIIPNDKYELYLYMLFRNPSFTSVIQRIAGGTSQKNLSPMQVSNYLLVNPSEKMLIDFNKATANIISTIVNNLVQNQELASLRDFLLPMLMNGQVTFKDEVKA